MPCLSVCFFLRFPAEIDFFALPCTCLETARETKKQNVYILLSFFLGGGGSSLPRLTRFFLF